MKRDKNKYKIIGDRVRQVRSELDGKRFPELIPDEKVQKKKVSQERFAEILECPLDTLRSIEQGNRPLSNHLAYKISKIAEKPTSIEWLLCETDLRNEAEVLIEEERKKLVAATRFLEDMDQKEESFAAFMVMLSDAMKESGIQLYSNGLKEFFSDFPEDVINNVPLHALPNMCTFKLKREDKTVAISGKQLTRLHRHLTRYLRTLIEEAIEEGSGIDGEQ